MNMHERPRVDMDFVDPFNISEIVDKDNFQKHLSISRDICDPTKAFRKITEETIPVDFSKLLDARIMHGAPDTNVPKHAHEGPVFRIIMSGEVFVNDKLYKPTDWMIIPTRYAYDLQSRGGYIALWVCVNC